MEATTPNSSHSPTTVSIDGRPSPPPHRNSMEDADSSVTRKRPRLDSGIRAHENITSPFFDSVGVDSSRGAEPPQSKPQALAANSPSRLAAAQEHQLQQAMGTPSKVTLNLRDPRLPRSPTTQRSLDTSYSPHTSDTSSTMSHRPSPEPEISACLVTPVHNVLPQDIQDVHIEISDPEDLDPTENTDTRNLASREDHTEWWREHLSKFPTQDHTVQSWEQEMRDIPSIALQEPGGLEGMLPKVEDWIQIYLAQTHQMSQHWSSLVVQNRSFWLSLPSILGFINGDKFASASNQRDFDLEEVASGLDGLLQAIIDLTAHMLMIDYNTLSNLKDARTSEPVIMSFAYIHVLHRIFNSKAENRSLRILERLGVDMPGPVKQITCGNGGAPSVLTGLGDCVPLLLAKTPTEAYSLKLLTAAVHFPSELYHLRQKLCRIQSSTDDGLSAPFLNFMLTLNTSLRRAIKKQAPALSGELLMNVFMTNMQSWIFASTDLVESLLTEFRPADIESWKALPIHDQNHLALTSWKIDVFQRCVREGRMEIRITGLEALQSGLIDLYNVYIRPRVSQDQHRQHSVVELISDQLLQSKLVDYILSVDSHPQIISRAGNIIGFLAVSGRWTDSQTDLIWESVGATEDQRVFETIIEMLHNVAKFLNSTDLAHFITRMQELSVAKFDLKVQSLFLQVCTYFIDKESEELDLVMVLMSTFTKLLRNASADSAVGLGQKRQMWEMVQGGFSKLTAVEWPSGARSRIYQDCCQDLKMRSPGTSGSCAVIRQLLERHARDDVAALSNDMDVANLVMDDFERLGQLHASTATDFRKFGHPVEDRLRILELMVLQLPQSVPPNLVRRLWSSIFVERTLGYVAREYVWDMLARLAMQSRSSNAFLDQCIDEHLPGLDPGLYSRSTLNFANYVLDYENRTRPTPVPGDDAPTETRASINLFWQLALNAEDDFVSNKASQALIDQASSQVRAQGDFERELRLIEKAVDQLVDIGNKLENQDSTQNNTSGSTVLQRRFTRLFTMLGQFVSAVQVRSPSSPSIHSDSQKSSNSSIGERIQIPYITSDRGRSAPQKHLVLKEHDTFEDLMSKLRMRTGYSKFNVISGGQRLKQEQLATEKLASLGLHRKGVLLVHRIPGSGLIRTSPDKGSIKSVDAVIMHRFDKLYELLTAKDVIALDVLKLLRSLGPHADVLQLVTSLENGQAEVLPMQHPYKASYSLYAMESKHRAHLSEGSIDLDFMKHSVKLLCDAIFAFRLPTPDQNAKVHLGLIEEVLNLLLALLKEPVPPDCANAYFAEPGAFVKKLHDISGLVEPLLGLVSMKVIQICFACLLEASTISDCVWEAFRAHGSSQGLFGHLILLNPDPQSRLVTHKTITSILSTLSGTIQPSKTLDKHQEASSPRQSPSRYAEIIEYFWKLSRGLIVDAATTRISCCPQFFDLALILFSTADEGVHDVQMLQSNIDSWTELLIEYDSQHHLGRDVTDWPIKGLSDLIFHAMALLKNKGVDPRTRLDFHERIFDALLFPPIQDLDTRESGTVTASVLGSHTRAALYRVVLRAAVDTGNPEKPLRLLTAVLNDEHTQALPYTGFDRAKCMRTSAGYPGLDNLSNTCYLNSLMTQLFMNLPFRDFVSRQQIHDPSSQALLLAMQRLFANLQDSWQKSICTKELAKSIQTYDGPLDPTIQMDADEAFNLLFDRLESQLPDASSRAAFKRLFGGQIIQQIKSKECEHVSERFEPITAVQCDIQGRHSLSQSLDAYIEGDNMEGDNKYKCSKCDRYVTAVKRACLKDIPDNLIFHLKRFDFDLLSGSRSKVNDFFEFPSSIDMSPYTFDFLENNHQGVGSDQFVLVGVLVHNGNAEVGHYYSYMRERPTASCTWVEFNDSEVSHFEQSMLPDQCFGGTTENFQQQTFPKVWNAYMLFYQRKSSLEAQQGSLTRHLEQPLIRADVNKHIAAEIAMHNEVMARTFCLSGQEHMVFVKDLLTAVLRKRGTQCSDDHIAEDTAIECVWAHIEKIFGRETKRRGTHDAIAFLETMTGSCSRCCLSSLRWTLAADEMRLRNVLIRPVDPDVRAKVVDITLRCIAELKDNLPAAYNLDEREEPEDDEMEDGNNVESGHGFFAQVLDRLASLQPVVALNYRSWPEYYRLLCELTRFGPKERAWMRQSGFLQNSLEVLLIDSHHDWASRYSGKHSHYIRLLEKRTYDLSNLLELIALLLDDLQVDSSSTILLDPAASSDQPFFLTRAERSVLSTKLIPEGGDVPVPWVLERAATVHFMRSWNRPLQVLTRFVLRNDTALKLQKGVLNIITHGIVKNPADLAIPYLVITLELLKTDISTALVDHVIQQVADGVKTIGDNGGSQHLEFFRRALQIQDDEALSDQPRQIKMAVIKNCPVWGSVLLDYPDIEVTQTCSSFLNQILFDLAPGDDEDDEIVELRGEASQSLWIEIRQLIRKYTRENQALDESKRPLLSFAGICLAQSVETDSHAMADYEALLEQAANMITPADDAASNAFESSDLTDVSSTYESPSLRKFHWNNG